MVLMFPERQSETFHMASGDEPTTGFILLNVSGGSSSPLPRIEIQKPDGLN